MSNNLIEAIFFASFTLTEGVHIYCLGGVFALRRQFYAIGRYTYQFGKFEKVYRAVEGRVFDFYSP